MQDFGEKLRGIDEAWTGPIEVGVTVDEGDAEGRGASTPAVPVALATGALNAGRIRMRCELAIHAARWAGRSRRLER